MRSSQLLFTVLAASIALLLIWTPVLAQGPRIVDTVRVGDSRSEAAHEYAGDGVTDAAADGRTYRRASGWQRYSLAVFDEATEVTIVCTFRGSAGETQRYELVVEGQKIAARSFRSRDLTPVRVELRVPVSVTKGRAVISVMLRASAGPTPGLMDMLTVQEHLELW